MDDVVILWHQFFHEDVVFSQTAVYALRAVAYLAAHQDQAPILAQTIAEEMDIPKNFLSKIMHQLVKRGMVRSTRGMRGGFELARQAQTIKMADVLAEFVDLTSYRRCILGWKDCDSSCGAHPRWIKIVENLNQLLDETTMDQIL